MLLYEKLINSKKDTWYVFNNEGKKYDLSIENNINGSAV